EMRNVDRLGPERVLGLGPRRVIGTILLEELLQSRDPGGRAGRLLRSRGHDEVAGFDAGWDGQTTGGQEVDGVLDAAQGRLGVGRIVGLEGPLIVPPAEAEAGGVLTLCGLAERRQCSALPVS